MNACYEKIDTQQWSRNKEGGGGHQYLTYTLLMLSDYS